MARKIRMDMRLAVKGRTTGIRLDAGKWEPVWYTKAMQGQGEEYQSYGMSADWKVVHAGVSRHPEMSETVARQMQRCWNRWRDEYLARNPGQYPLRDAYKVAYLVVQRMGQSVGNTYPVA